MKMHTIRNNNAVRIKNDIELHSQDKLFVNAIFKSLRLQYTSMISLFLIAPMGLVYLLLVVFRANNYQLNPPVVAFTMLTVFFFLVLLLTAIFLRKYWIFKIITNNTGIYFIGFFRRLYCRWNEVNSVSQISSLLGKARIEVNSIKGSFSFPLTMKEMEEVYPVLVMGIEWMWKDGSGNKDVVRTENCPLYMEIMKHIVR